MGGTDGFVCNLSFLDKSILDKVYCVHGFQLSSLISYKVGGVDRLSLNTINLIANILRGILETVDNFVMSSLNTIHGIDYVL
ncbi:hypothetical protein BELL_1231g00020 [Botrytis elliptica]|uniref:Uncharacterized protein n=1 Tax=Botrytis elliptica TaxID=278938 RepID=A0A4Z1ISR6_9HELO|nr:hypothetical protein BELL_1231g00020 [Botrytis elliptica]